jgi:hypothetical protein
MRMPGVANLKPSQIQSSANRFLKGSVSGVTVPNAASIARPLMKKLGPAKAASDIQTALRNIDPTNPHSETRRQLRQLDPARQLMSLVVPAENVQVDEGPGQVTEETGVVTEPELVLEDPTPQPEPPVAEPPVIVVAIPSDAGSSGTESISDADNVPDADSLSSDSQGSEAMDAIPDPPAEQEDGSQGEAQADPASTLVRIENPAQYNAEWSFLVNGQEQRLAAGQVLECSAGCVVEFDQGGTLGTAEYTLTEGTYTFMWTEDSQWDLRKADGSATPEAESQPASDSTLEEG